PPPPTPNDAIRTPPHQPTGSPPRQAMPGEPNQDPAAVIPTTNPNEAPPLPNAHRPPSRAASMRQHVAVEYEQPPHQDPQHQSLSNTPPSTAPTSEATAKHGHPPSQRSPHTHHDHPGLMTEARSPHRDLHAPPHHGCDAGHPKRVSKPPEPRRHRGQHPCPAP
ncbi:hypothetical protein BDK51DRAFT_10729, partial [Blyttiomyces helicus]